jgi:CRP/FNR family transcriptional regulator
MTNAGTPLDTPLLSGLNAAATRIVAERAITRRFARGETLWTVGGVPRGLFVIVEGRVRVVRAPDGRQYTVHTEGPGGTLGEVPLFAGGRYPATAVAEVPTVCRVLDRNSLGHAMAADPDLAFRLLGRLAGRVRTLIGRLDRQAGETVRSRLVAFLLARCAEAGPGPFTLGATQAEMAEELGTVREVLVRTIRELKDEGLIRRVGRGCYEVADLEGLRLAAVPARRLSRARFAGPPEPSGVVAALDAIPGALERANEGLREIRSGKGIPLDDL